MGLKLYQVDLSPFATRVRILARAKNLKLECVPPPGGLKSEDFLMLNPLGRIPCLEHEGKNIPESETICEYLEDCFPTPTLRPVDPQARARARLLSRMGDLYLAPPFAKLFSHFDPATRDENVVQQAFFDMETVIGTMTNYIEGPDYAVGGRLSLADCTLIPLFFLLDAALSSTFGRRSPLRGSMHLYFRNAQEDPHIGRSIEEMRVAFQERFGR